MKNLIGLILLLVSNATFSQQQVHEAVLNLSVQIDELCNENLPFCTIVRTIRLGGIKVPLFPQDEMDVCEPTTGTNCDTSDAYHYRGIWSSVAERDGERAIAIVSIDKFKIAGTDDISTGGFVEEAAYSYTIEAEILGDKGLEAKVRISTDDLKNLNDVTLEGNVRNVAGSRYQASLIVGPHRAPTPTPCLPNDNSDECEIKTNNAFKGEVELELIKGSIK